MNDRNLIILHRGPEYERDFKPIAERVQALDPAISVFCLSAGAKRISPEPDWTKPSLTVALQQTFRVPIRRGPVLANRPIHKPGQHRIFLAAGLPAPPTLPFVPGMKLDPIMFGEYVVIKPGDPQIGSYGRGVQLFRRRKLEKMRYADFPRDHFIHRDPQGYLVQRFIDSGPLITLYRVLTLFGAPLYCWLAREKLPRPPVAGTDEEIEALRITNNGPFRERFLTKEQDVLDLSTRVGNAFPDIPILGMDILREEKSGKLYVLEVNPGGNTWHFSSKLTTRVRQEMGGLSLHGERKSELLGWQMMVDQFGAFDRAAEVLAEITRNRAA